MKKIFDDKCPYCGAEHAGIIRVHTDGFSFCTNEYECSNCHNKYKVTSDFKNTYFGSFDDVFTEEELDKAQKEYEENNTEIIELIKKRYNDSNNSEPIEDPQRLLNLVIDDGTWAQSEEGKKQIAEIHKKLLEKEYKVFNNPDIGINISKYNEEVENFWKDYIIQKVINKGYIKDKRDIKSIRIDKKELDDGNIEYYAKIIPYSSIAEFDIKLTID